MNYCKSVFVALLVAGGISSSQGTASSSSSTASPVIMDEKVRASFAEQYRDIPGSGHAMRDLRTANDPLGTRPTAIGLGLKVLTADGYQMKRRATREQSTQILETIYNINRTAGPLFNWEQYIAEALKKNPLKNDPLYAKHMRNTYIAAMYFKERLMGRGTSIKTIASNIEKQGAAALQGATSEQILRFVRYVDGLISTNPSKFKFEANPLSEFVKLYNAVPNDGRRLDPLNGTLKTLDNVLVPRFEGVEPIAYETPTYRDVNLLVSYFAPLDPRGLKLETLKNFASYHFLIGDDEGHHVLYAYTPFNSLLPAGYTAGMTPLSSLPSDLRAKGLIMRRALEMQDKLSNTYTDSLYPIQVFRSFGDEGPHFSEDFHKHLKMVHGQVGKEPLVLEGIEVPGTDPHAQSMAMPTTESKEHFSKIPPDTFERLFPGLTSTMDETRDQILFQLGTNKAILEMNFNETMMDSDIADKCAKHFPKLRKDQAVQLVKAYFRAKTLVLDGLFDLVQKRNTIDAYVEVLRDDPMTDKVNYAERMFKKLDTKPGARPLVVSAFTSTLALKQYSDFLTSSEFNSNTFALICRIPDYFKDIDPLYKNQILNLSLSQILFKYFYTSKILYRYDPSTRTVYKMSVGLPSPDMADTLTKYIKETFGPDVKVYGLDESLGHQHPAAEHPDVGSPSILQRQTSLKTSSHYSSKTQPEPGKFSSATLAATGSQLSSVFGKKPEEKK